MHLGEAFACTSITVFFFLLHSIPIAISIQEEKQDQWFGIFYMEHNPVAVQIGWKKNSPDTKSWPQQDLHQCLLPPKHHQSPYTVAPRWLLMPAPRPAQSHCPRAPCPQVSPAASLMGWVCAWLPSRPPSCQTPATRPASGNCAARELLLEWISVAWGFRAKLHTELIC